MQTYVKFLYDFLDQLFRGFKIFFEGLIKGITQLFNIMAYKNIIKHYSNDFSVSEWVLFAIVIGVVIILLGIIAALIYLKVKRKIKARQKGLNQQELLDEIGMLNNKVIDLVNEKEDILAMKVSQMGLSPR